MMIRFYKWEIESATTGPKHPDGEFVVPFEVSGISTMTVLNRTNKPGRNGSAPSDTDEGKQSVPQAEPLTRGLRLCFPAYALCTMGAVTYHGWEVVV